MRAPDRTWSLGALHPEEFASWELLANRCSTGYFSGPVWCSSWFESFAPSSSAEVGVWTDGNDVVAVAPMVRTTEAILPGGAGRRIQVHTWQNAGAGLGGADHLGFACRADLRPDVADWALRRRGTVQLLALGDDWSGVLAGLGASRRAETRTYEVSLADGPRPGSKKLWKHIARSRRQLVERGAVFDHLIGSEIDRQTLSELFALHGMRSASVGRRTTFTTARQRFHERLAERSTTSNASFVVRAHLGGELVGGLYGFMDERRVHYYQSGWDPELERSSLGSILIGEAIDLAVERGASTFDFLRGDEPYKLRFGARASLDSSFFVPRGVGGAALRAKDAVARLLAHRRERAEDRPAGSESIGSDRAGAPHGGASEGEQS